MAKLSNTEKAWLTAEHELRATKQEFDDFRQYVSYSIEDAIDKNLPVAVLRRFIIHKPDPLLVEIFDECFNQNVLEGETWSEAMARKTKAAMDARGLEIREKNDG